MKARNTASMARTPTPAPIPALAPVESPLEEAEWVGSDPPTAAVLEAEFDVNAGVWVVILLSAKVAADVVAILVSVEDVDDNWIFDDGEEMVVCGDLTDIETPSSAHVLTT